MNTTQRGQSSLLTLILLLSFFCLSPFLRAQMQKEGDTVTWNSSGGNVRVMVGSNVEVKPDETVDMVVVVGGDAVIDGEVRQNVVVIGGRLKVNGLVHGQVVNVFGNTEFGSEARVRGEAVVVLGNVKRDSAASVPRLQVVPFGGMPPFFEPAKAFFKHGLLLGRPLPPNVGWVRMTAAILLFLYFCLAMLFPRAVQACANSVGERPATSFFTGILVFILVPILLVLLVALVVGLIFGPFLICALLVAILFGKIGICRFIGGQVGKQFNSPALQSAPVAIIVGCVLLDLIYMVPFLGMLMWGLTTLLALGAATLAIVNQFKRETPATTPLPKLASVPISAPAPSIVPPVSSATSTPMPAPAANETTLATDLPMNTTEPIAATTSLPPISVEPTTSQAAPPLNPPLSPPPIPPMSSGFNPPPLSASVLRQATHNYMDESIYPRAGFWLRFATALIDLVPVVVLALMIHHFITLIVLTYFIGMWAWRGTTLGGIVLGLRVARLDGKPVDFPVALVRGLGCIFSLVVLGLGFLWIAWDSEKQGWHDKIAGTVVVIVPKSSPLI